MILQNNHRVSNAVRFKVSEANNTWYLIGGTDSWENENDPPEVPGNLSEIGSLLGAKKATLYWVKPDPSGTLIFIGPTGEERWSLIATEEEAYTSECRWVLVESVLSGTEDGAIPLTPFRIVAVSLGVEHTQGSASAVAAADITSQGKLQSVEYSVARTRVETSSYKISSIVEF